MKQVILKDHATFLDLWGYWQLGERYLQGAAQIRQAIRVYDKLEPFVAGVDAVAWPAAVELEDADHALLKSAITTVLEKGINALTPQTGIAYRPLDARRAAAVLDLLAWSER